MHTSKVLDPYNLNLAILWAFKFGPFCLKSVRETGSSNVGDKFMLYTRNKVA